MKQWKGRWVSCQHKGFIMVFRLIYQGPLHSGQSRKTVKHKQHIRRQLHPQLKRLWRQEPADSLYEFLRTPEQAPEGEAALIKQVSGFKFAPLVSSQLQTLAELDILLLKPQPLGDIVQQGGDIDNRLKTLLDAMTIPNPEQISDEYPPLKNESPLFCLLEDDSLISHLSVTTDRLLAEGDENEVFLVIKVNVVCTKMTRENMRIFSPLTR